MKKSSLVLHAVDGQVAVTFMPALTGFQISAVFRSAQTPLGTRALMEEIHRMAREWGITPQIELRKK